MKSKINFSDKAGFTLIELIVVIAILAILGGISTVGYSAYVNKANEAADRQMISDIEQALILGAYSQNYAPGSVVGAVGVSKGSNAACSTDDFDGNGVADIDEMMIRAFGENWENVLRLEGEFFSDSDASNIKNAMNGVNGAYFDSVPDSSFYGTNGATDDLAAKVDEIASAFKGILGDENGYKFANFWGTDFGNKVKDENLNIKDSQTAANLTVMAAANAIANDTGSHADWIASWQDDSKEPEINSTDNGYVAPLVMNYAKYVSLVSYVNDPANGVDVRDRNTVNDNYSTLVAAMGNLSNKSEDTSYIQAFNAAMNTFEEQAITGKSYYTDWQKNQAKTDAEAFIASMAAVNALESTYVNKDKANVLNKQNAFTEFGAADVLDTMVNYASMSALPNGDYVIVLSIAADGTPVITPTLQEE